MHANETDFCGRVKSDARDIIQRHRLSGRSSRRSALLLPARPILFGLAFFATVGELHAQRVEVDAGVGNYVGIVGCATGAVSRCSLSVRLSNSMPRRWMPAACCPRCAPSYDFATAWMCI